MIPLKHQVIVKKYTEPVIDEFGNNQPVWVETRIDVYGWFPRGTFNLLMADMDTEDYDINILVPAGFQINHMDKVILDGKEYRMIGEMMDYTNSPFTYTPGSVVRIKRIEG